MIGIILLLIAGLLLIRYISSYESTDAFVDGHTDPITPRINGIVTGSYEPLRGL